MLVVGKKIQSCRWCSPKSLWAVFEKPHPSLCPNCFYTFLIHALTSSQSFPFVLLNSWWINFPEILTCSNPVLLFGTRRDACYGKHIYKKTTICEDASWHNKVVQDMLSSWTVMNYSVCWCVHDSHRCAIVEKKSPRMIFSSSCVWSCSGRDEVEETISKVLLNHQSYSAT